MNSWPGRMTDNNSYINNLSKKFKNEREMLIDKGQVFMLIEKNNDIFNLPTYIVKLQINKSI